MAKGTSALLVLCLMATTATATAISLDSLFKFNPLASEVRASDESEMSVDSTPVLDEAPEVEGEAKDDDDLQGSEIKYATTTVIVQITATTTRHPVCMTTYGVKPPCLPYANPALNYANHNYNAGGYKGGKEDDEKVSRDESFVELESSDPETRIIDGIMARHPPFSLPSFPSMPSMPSMPSLPHISSLLPFPHERGTVTHTITKTIQVTKVSEVIDHKVTAVLVAHNCVPINMDIPMCPAPLPTVSAAPAIPISHGPFASGIGSPFFAQIPHSPSSLHIPPYPIVPSYRPSSYPRPNGYGIHSNNHQITPYSQGMVFMTPSGTFYKVHPQSYPPTHSYPSNPSSYRGHEEAVVVLPHGNGAYGPAPQGGNAGGSVVVLPNGNVAFGPGPQGGNAGGSVVVLPNGNGAFGPGPQGGNAGGSVVVLPNGNGAFGPGPQGGNAGGSVVVLPNGNGAFGPDPQGGNAGGSVVVLPNGNGAFGPGPQGGNAGGAVTITGTVGGPSTAPGSPNTGTVVILPNGQGAAPTPAQGGNAGGSVTITGTVGGPSTAPGSPNTGTVVILPNGQGAAPAPAQGGNAGGSVTVTGTVQGPTGTVPGSSGAVIIIPGGKGDVHKYTTTNKTKTPITTTKTTTTEKHEYVEQHSQPEHPKPEHPQPEYPQPEYPKPEHPLFTHRPGYPKEGEDAVLEE